MMSTLMLKSGSEIWCCSLPSLDYDPNWKKYIVFYNGMKHEKYETKSKNIKWKTSRLIRFSHMVKSFNHEIFSLFYRKISFLNWNFWWKMAKKVKVVDSLREKFFASVDWMPMSIETHWFIWRTNEFNSEVICEFRKI